MKRVSTFVAGAMLAMVLAGCGAPALEGPPEVHFGRDECAHCGMIINDARYASALIAEHNGEPRALRFDDIGDHVAYLQEHKDVRPTRQYVHDQGTREWVDATAAWYAVAPDLHTPMGSGVVAFAKAGDRDDFLKTHATDNAVACDFASLSTVIARQERP